MDKNAYFKHTSTKLFLDFAHFFDT